MSDLRLTQSSLPHGVTGVQAEGILDSESSAAVRSLFGALLEDARCRVALRLSGVERLSPTAVGILVSALDDAKSTGGDVVLVAPSGAVMAVLDKFGLAKLFRIAETEEQAVKFFETAE